MAMLLLAGASHAQTEKGRWMVGSSSNLLSSQDNVGSTNAGFYLTLGPDAPTTWGGNLSFDGGYFVANNLLLGANVGIFAVGYEDDSSLGIVFGSALRYYAGSKKFRPFAELQGNILASEGQSRFNVGGTAGGAYFFRNNLSADVFVGYSRTAYEQEADFDNVKLKQKLSTIGLGVGISMFF